MCVRLTGAAQAMGHHPASVRLFAEWSYRRLLKSGAKFAFVEDPEKFINALFDKKDSDKKDSDENGSAREPR